MVLNVFEEVAVLAWLLLGGCDYVRESASLVFQVRQLLRGRGFEAVFGHFERFESDFNWSLFSWSYEGKVVPICTLIAQLLKQLPRVFNAVEWVAWYFKFQQFYSWWNLRLLSLLDRPLISFLSLKPRDNAPCRASPHECLRGGIGDASVHLYLLPTLRSKPSILK